VAEDAGWQAFVATTFALVPWWMRGVMASDTTVSPRVTYTQPEAASVGMSEEEVVAAYGPEGREWWLIRVGNDELDRAVTDGEPAGGFVEAYIHRRGRVLGASIVSNRAGELISTVAVAIQNRLHVRDLALTIQPSSSYAYALHKVSEGGRGEG